MQAHLIESPHGNLRIWDPPQDGVEYAIGADVAEGKVRDRGITARRTTQYRDSRPDFSAACVVEAETGHHVATWHGYVPPDEYATILAALGMHYNNALIVPEINGPGIAVVTALTERIQYPNVYRSRLFNVHNPTDPLLSQWGFRTDNHTRPLLIGLVSASINNNACWTRDSRLVAEIRTMEFDDQGRERGRGRNKDDLVFAYALALHGRETILVYSGVPSKDKRKPDDHLWDQVERQVEQKHEQRNSGRGRGLYPRWGRIGDAGRPGR